MTVIWKGTVEIGEGRLRPILVRQFGTDTRRQRPCDTNAVPANAAVMVWGIGVGTFVCDFASVLKRDEAVGEADGNEQLMTVLRRQFGADPSPVGWRSRAHVDGDIEDPSTNATDQLVLTALRGLEMQPA